MPDTRIWMYRGEEAKLFDSSADIPEGEGWARRPGEKSVEPIKGDVEVGEPEKIEEIPEEDIVKPEVDKPKRKYRRRKG